MAAIEKKAAESGMTVSAFVRLASLERAERATFLDDDARVLFDVLREDLRKIGVNLNQMARALNTGKHRERDEIMVHLDAVAGVTSYLKAQIGLMLRRAAKANHAHPTGEGG